MESRAREPEAKKATGTCVTILPDEIGRSMRSVLCVCVLCDVIRETKFTFHGFCATPRLTHCGDGNRRLWLSKRGAPETSILFLRGWNAVLSPTPFGGLSYQLFTVVHFSVTSLLRFLRFSSLSLPLPLSYFFNFLSFSFSSVWEPGMSVLSFRRLKRGALSILSSRPSYQLFTAVLTFPLHRCLRRLNFLYILFSFLFWPRLHWKKNYLRDKQYLFGVYW